MPHLKKLVNFDHTNPVLYENDSHEDVYTDEYLIALASSGDINLTGMVTTISYTDPWQKPEIQFSSLVNGRLELVGKARRSGMINIPNPVEGPSTSLTKPESGKIEDTIPKNSPGGRLIVEQAKKASREKPLVIVMGGQATAVADAYLLDPSITENVIISWLVGSEEIDQPEYNGWVDTWGTYIILTKFNTVMYGTDSITFPVIPKQRLTELPDTELRQWMIEKELPHVNGPGERDFDAPPALPIMRPDYIKKVVMRSFSHFDKLDQCVLKDDENGNITSVIETDQYIATQEWWRALTNPKIYGNGPLAPVNIPFNAKPFQIPGIVIACEFDFGGNGISYNCSRHRHGSQVLKTTFRMTDHVSYDVCNDNPNLFIVEPLETGEWLAYTINVEKTGTYHIEVLAASGKNGGIFHLDLDGKNMSGEMNVPCCSDWQNWAKIEKKEVALTAGTHIIRLTCDSGLFSLKQITFK